MSRFIVQGNNNTRCIFGVDKVLGFFLDVQSKVPTSSEDEFEVSVEEAGMLGDKKHRMEIADLLEQNARPEYKEVVKWFRECCALDLDPKDVPQFNEELDRANLQFVGGTF